MKTMNHTRRLIYLFVLLLALPASAQFLETTTYDDGSVYTGQRNGKGQRHGKGQMTWPTGDRYDGQWKKGVIDGCGTGGGTAD